MDIIFRDASRTEEQDADLVSGDSEPADVEFGAALIAQTASLSGYARRLAGPGADADDLLQDTLLRCWAARTRFMTGTNLAAWSRTVMRNSFLSGHRRARFQADMPDDAIDRMMWVEENQSWTLALKDAAWALGELAPEQREAVLLASQGVSVEEGAAQIGIAEGTFKSRVWRGRVRLVALVEDRSTPLLAQQTLPEPVKAQDERPKRPRKKRDWRGVVIG